MRINLLNVKRNFFFLRLTSAGTGVGVGLKTENRKINEKKRPSAIIKAILGTVTVTLHRRVTM